MPLGSQNVSFENRRVSHALLAFWILLFQECQSKPCMVLSHADHGGVVERQPAAWPDQAPRHSFWAVRSTAAGRRAAAGRFSAQLDLTGA